MLLRELTANLPGVLCRAEAQTRILGLTADSRSVQPGFLFAALPGAQDDGARHIDEALSRGAACVLTQQPLPPGTPQLCAADAREALARLAARWYGTETLPFRLVGVTGTNGKTTVTHLVRQLLMRCCGAKVGLIGTNGVLLGDETLPAARTTPDSLTLHALLARMAEAGCTHVVMEVSSHALSQHRVTPLVFDAAGFTNLTRDHLDYHGTMDAYCDAKARLFSVCRAAVVNGDDPWTPRLLRACPCPVTRYGLGLTGDLAAFNPHYENDGVRFTVCDDAQRLETRIAIPGEFSLYNALCALGLMRALGVPLREAAQALRQCTGVRGRAEVVRVPRGCTVLIDYAHTPDGLESILKTVAAFAKRRVWVLFGCGGDRDRGKRAEMGRIAAALADFVVLTSDNPRTESPYAILHDVLCGLRESKTPFAVLENRREAIAFALSHAQSGDVLVLAGKGHETCQIIGTQAYPLDEREVVRSYFETKEAGSPAEENHHENDPCLHSQLCCHGGCGPRAHPDAAAHEGAAEHP